MEKIYKGELERIDALAIQLNGISKMFEKIYETPENKINQSTDI